jgi:hypothetical protein
MGKGGDTAAADEAAAMSDAVACATAGAREVSPALGSSSCSGGAPSGGGSVPTAGSAGARLSRLSGWRDALAAAPKRKAGEEAAGVAGAIGGAAPAAGSAAAAAAAAAARAVRPKLSAPPPSSHALLRDACRLDLVPPTPEELRAEAEADAADAAARRARSGADGAAAASAALGASRVLLHASTADGQPLDDLLWGVAPSRAPPPAPPPPPLPVVRAAAAAAEAAPVRGLRLSRCPALRRARCTHAPCAATRAQAPVDAALVDADGDAVVVTAPEFISLGASRAPPLRGVRATVAARRTPLPRLPPAPVMRPPSPLRIAPGADTRLCVPVLPSASVRVRSLSRSRALARSSRALVRRWP